MFFTFFKNLFLSKKDKYLNEIRIYSERLEESTGFFLKPVLEDDEQVIQIYDGYGDEWGDTCPDLATVQDVTGCEVYSC
tara:strand:- start:764 stop:1000 length:237 start_codon:yes stop_codon:yes gene_type:complete